MKLNLVDAMLQIHTYHKYFYLPSKGKALFYFKFQCKYNSTYGYVPENDFGKLSRVACGKELFEHVNENVFGEFPVGAVLEKAIVPLEDFALLISDNDGFNSSLSTNFFDKTNSPTQTMHFVCTTQKVFFLFYTKDYHGISLRRHFIIHQKI